MDNQCRVDNCNNQIEDSIISQCPEHSPPCPICLVGVGVGDDVSQMRCGHTFHSCCIYGWLDIKRNCPMCRRLPI